MPGGNDLESRLRSMGERVLALSHDLPFLSRWASHAAIALLIASIVLGGQIDWAWNQPVQASSLGADQPSMESDGSSELGSRRGQDYLTRAAVPKTTIPKRVRTEVIVYTVQAGDTLLDIAERFGISGETIMWANGRMEENPDLLAIGQELILLPVSGVYHTVQENDTLVSIAARYKVEISAIIEYDGNDLEEPYDLEIGQKLIVPGGEKPYVPRRVFAYSGPVPEDATKGSGAFGWPVSGRITQKFWNGHRAIDIGAPQGMPIYAADSGYVAVAGWSDIGYGRMVIIDHGNNFQTLYAHMQVFYVEAGQSVGKGQKIGVVGSTGNSTGPHLHFEIILKGVRRNPLIYLP